MDSISSWITQGPNPIFSESEIPCLTGRNINKGRVNYNNADYVSEIEYQNLKRFQLKKGDTLITLKGKGSIGKIGYVTDERKSIFSRDIGVIRPNKINSAYVNAFILSKFGSKIIERGETGGTGQSTLTASYLRSIDIPRIKIESEIGKLIEQSEEILSSSIIQYTQAETILLQEIGLENFTPSKEPVNIKSFNESFGVSGRLDAEYYQKKYQDYENKIVSQKHTYIKKEYTHITTSSKKDKVGYNYIEIGDVNVGDGSNKSNYILTNDLPANAKTLVEKGDILISNVRPYRGAVSIINKVENDLIVSGAFTVLRKNSNSIFNNEVLKVLLRSSVYKDWLLKFNVGTSYPVIKDEDVLNMPIPFISADLQIQIAELVEESFKLKSESERLLEVAKKAVEIAIEEGEDKAMEYIINNKK